LERVCAGEGAAACVTAVYAFGSRSRGALEVGDVDLDIECDRSRDPETAQQIVDLLVAGRVLDLAAAQGAETATDAARFV
jgi:hypothetical protein